MRRSLCVLVDHPPYGRLQPAEAIRHARGALGKGWEVVLAFVGDSVYTLLPGQTPRVGEWVCLSESVTEFVCEGKERASVLVEEHSLEARALSENDLIQGIRPASLDEIARAMARCDRTLIF
ncbi:MAG: DsrE family protein [Candidatus Methylomirabilia bacterium]